MTALSVRPARPAEYDAIAELTVAAYRAGDLLVDAGEYARVLADVTARAAQGDVLVAVEGEQVLGTVTFVLAGGSYAEIARPGEAEFRMLAVDPAAQRRGVASALIEACLERAKVAGAVAVVICTRDIMHTAQHLYARFGFVRTPALDWSPRPGVHLWALRLDLLPIDQGVS